MKKEEARQIAQNWVETHRQEYPQAMGAYIAGSYLETPPGALWPESSDVDIVLVFPQGACPPKLGKFRENSLLLEVSCLEEGEFSTIEKVLSTHYLAYALQAGEILYDPQGCLARLHRQAAAQYAQPKWVNARCEAFYQRIAQSVSGYDPQAMTLPQKVNGWAFTTGITCFPVLLAALGNCTVRKRYTAARQALEAYGLGGHYPRLLQLLAPHPLGDRVLSQHMDQLEETFYLACASRGPSAGYAFRSDISPEGAAVAIGGSRQLIASAHPEDAVFWMLATFARCHIILDMDDPGASTQRLPALWAFLRDLGIGREEDFGLRLAQLADFLPALRAIAGEVALRRESRVG